MKKGEVRLLCFDGIARVIIGLGRFLAFSRLL